MASQVQSITKQIKPIPSSVICTTTPTSICKDKPEEMNEPHLFDADILNKPPDNEKKELDIIPFPILPSTANEVDIPPTTQSVPLSKATRPQLLSDDSDVESVSFVSSDICSSSDEETTNGESGIQLTPLDDQLESKDLHLLPSPHLPRTWYKNERKYYRLVARNEMRKGHTIQKDRNDEIVCMNRSQVQGTLEQNLENVQQVLQVYTLLTNLSTTKQYVRLVPTLSTTVHLSNPRRLERYTPK